MKQRILPLLLVLVLCLPAAALSEMVDPLGSYEETITLTTSRAMNSTTQFDENDPEKKNYAENRWTNAFLEFLNIDLQYDWIASDDDSNIAKWSAAIASGNAPDFAIVSDSVYKLLLDSDMIADMTDLYDQYASEGYKALLDDVALDQLTFGGRMYGLPYPSKGYHGMTALFVRGDWLDALGLSFPESYEEMLDVARAFQAAQLGGENTFGLMFSGNASADGKLHAILNVFGAYLDYWLDIDGKLAWSNVQPEMREALLALQALYTEGLINKDFAVTTIDLAKEYVSSGKVGIFYANSSATTNTIQALYDNDPNVAIESSTIKGRGGEAIVFQTNTPRTGRIFVNANCEHPEAVVKMLNLAYELTSTPENYALYGISDGHMWFKYLPFADMPKSQLNDLIGSYEIALAEEAGAKSYEEYPFTVPDAAGWYGEYLLSKEGKAPVWYNLTFGPTGTYTLAYHAYNEGRHLPNAYVGLPTETQELKGDIINDALSTAMYEVIMGADISVYDAACEAWYRNGGQQVTDELNEMLGR